jgi:NADPH:quinone reductase-like Zn-dependent oxidoreductase
LIKPTKRCTDVLTPSQIAAAAGATVIATSSSDEKLELARKLGATHTINYRKTPDWSNKALELTGGVGVDLVVEVVGGGGLADSINSLRYGGRIGLVGILDKEDKPIAPTKPLLFGGKTSEFSSLNTVGPDTDVLFQSKVPLVVEVETWGSS